MKKANRDASNKTIKKGGRKVFALKQARRSSAVLLIISAMIITAIPVTTPALQTQAAAISSEAMKNATYGINPDTSAIMDVYQTNMATPPTVYSDESGDFQFVKAGSRSAALVRWRQHTLKDESVPPIYGKLPIPEKVDAYQKWSESDKGGNADLIAVNSDGKELYYHKLIFNSTLYRQDELAHNADPDNVPEPKKYDVNVYYTVDTAYTPCLVEYRKSSLSAALDNEGWTYNNAYPLYIEKTTVTSGHDREFPVYYIASDYVAEDITANKTNGKPVWHWFNAGEPNTTYASGENPTMGVFGGAGNITNLIISDAVLGIGDYAFYDCVLLPKVTFGNGITEIGKSAFKNCLILDSLYVDVSLGLQNSKLSKIGAEAFYGCEKLTNIGLPNTLTALSDSTFVGCKALRTVSFGAVTELGDRVFADCTGLENITFTEKVTDIGTNTFTGCSSLQSVKLDPKYTANLTFSKFMGCTSLEYISAPNVAVDMKSGTISGGVPSDAEWTEFINMVTDGFYFESDDTRPLETNPANIAKLRKAAWETGLAFKFYGKDIYEWRDRFVDDNETPNDLSDDEKALLFVYQGNGSSQLSNIIIPAGLMIGEPTLDPSTNKPTNLATETNWPINIPSRIGPFTITEIANTAFSNIKSSADNVNFKRLTIPSSIRSIADRTFTGCTALENIYFDSPSGISIGENAFNTGLKADGTMASVNPVNFYNVDANLNPVFMYAMTDPNIIVHTPMPAHLQVQLDMNGSDDPTELTYNPNYGTAELISYPVLNELGVYNKNNYFDNQDAYTIGNTSFTSITLPAGIESIKKGLFNDLDGKSPKGDGNTNITTITVKAPGLTTLEEWPFGGCTKLNAVNFDDGCNFAFTPNGSNGGVIYKLNAQEQKAAVVQCLPTTVGTVTIDPTATTIWGSAFRNDGNVRTVNIPAGVKEFPNYAFSGSGLLFLNLSDAISPSYINPKAFLSSGDDFPGEPASGDLIKGLTVTAPETNRFFNQIIDEPTKYGLQSPAGWDAKVRVQESTVDFIVAYNMKKLNTDGPVPAVNGSVDTPAFNLANYPGYRFGYWEYTNKSNVTTKKLTTDATFKDLDPGHSTIYLILEPENGQYTVFFELQLGTSDTIPLNDGNSRPAIGGVVATPEIDESDYPGYKFKYWRYRIENSDPFTYIDKINSVITGITKSGVMVTAIFEPSNGGGNGGGGTGGGNIYNPDGIDPDNPNYITVTFIGFYNQIVPVIVDKVPYTQQFIKDGGTAKAPGLDTVPTKNGANATGWSPSYWNLKATVLNGVKQKTEITINALYDTAGDSGSSTDDPSVDGDDKITVTFLDYHNNPVPVVVNGKTLYHQYIKEGKNATPPNNNSVPTPDGQRFLTWEPANAYINVKAASSTGTGTGSTGNTGTKVKTSINITAKYEPGSAAGAAGTGPFSVTFIDYQNKPIPVRIANGSIVSTQKVKGGENAVIPTNKDIPVPSGQVFKSWATTEFINVTKDAMVLAVYEAKNGSDGSGGSGSGSSNGGSGSVAGSAGTNTVLEINKPGFSDTGVANAVVAGSTDNFVMRITDDTSAKNEAEAALLADTSSMQNILYFPMDISLYDATGETKITDTTGLSVTITLPIPDQLRPYGGNVKAAHIANGHLEPLPVTFKSINGVPCISFVAKDFSPYVLYVDTNNLVAGESEGGIGANPGSGLDSTPKTGDPIHPKWFLVGALIALSMALFLVPDRKKVVIEKE